MVISIKANCIDSTAPPEQVFAQEVQKLKAEKIKPFEQITLEPFERGRLSSWFFVNSRANIRATDHCIVTGRYVRT